MHVFSRLLALVTIGAAGSSGGLLAQVRGLPVRNAGIGTGIGIAADVGFPNGSGGKGLALGATGTVGGGPLGASGSVARWDPKGSGSTINSVGATGNLKIFGGPLIPVAVTLQAGVGYSSHTTTVAGNQVTDRSWHVPAGVGLTLTIPNPAFSIKPWIAPRIDVLRTSQTGLGSSTDTNFGISGGVDLGFLSGLSIRAMYDRVQKGGGVHPSALSVGLGFRVGT